MIFNLSAWGRILTKCPQLEILDVRQCYQPSPSPSINNTGTCALVNLNLSVCAMTADFVHFLHLVKSCQRTLKHLVVRLTPGFQAEELSAVQDYTSLGALPQFPHLRLDHFNLQMCKVQILAPLLRLCPNLMRQMTRGYFDISESLPPRLLHQLPRLGSLSISFQNENEYLAYDTLDMLQAHLQPLRHSSLTSIRCDNLTAHERVWDNNMEIMLSGHPLNETAKRLGISLDFEFWPSDMGLGDGLDFDFSQYL